MINLKKPIAPEVRLFGALTPHLIDIPHRRINLDQNMRSFSHDQYIVDTLLNCASGSAISKDKDRSNVTPTPNGLQTCLPGQKSVPVVLSACYLGSKASATSACSCPKSYKPTKQERCRGRVSWRSRSSSQMARIWALRRKSSRLLFEVRDSIRHKLKIGRWNFRT